MKNSIKSFSYFLLTAIFFGGCVSIMPDVPEIKVPFTQNPPEINGTIDENCWQDAALIDGLYPASDKDTSALIQKLPTKIRLLWDRDFLYVAFACTDPDIFMSGKLENDDDLYKEDVCEVFIDGKGDGNQFVEIQVNPQGKHLDLMYVFTGKPEYTPQFRFTQEFCNTDRWGFREWNMEGLQTAGKLVYENGRPIGWNVEMAIPAKLIVKRSGAHQFSPDMSVQANFLRYDWVLDEKTGKRDLLHMNWSPVLHGCPHISPSLMGKLILIDLKKNKDIL